MLRERSSDIPSFFEHPIYSNFKMYSLLILLFLFWFTTIHPKYFCKRHFSWKFQVLRERSSDSTLYIAFWKCVIFWFYIFYFNCQYSAKILLEKSFFLEILVAPRKKQWYSFFRGASCISHFQDLYSPDSTFSILIYDDLPTVVLQKSFFLEILSVPQEKQWYCIFCGTSYIYQFQIVKFPNSSFFYFVLSFIYLFLSFFNQNVSERFIYSGNFYAPPKEQWYWFFYGPPCI